MQAYISRDFQDTLLDDRLKLGAMSYDVEIGRRVAEEASYLP